MKMAKEKIEKMLMSPFGIALLISLVMATGILTSMTLLLGVFILLLGLYTGWKKIKSNEEMKALVAATALVVIFGVYKFATITGQPSFIFLDNFLSGLAFFGVGLVVIPLFRMMGMISKN